MKRFAIAFFGFLITTSESHGTAHQVGLSKVRRQYLQQVTCVKRPNNILVLEILKFLSSYKILLSQAAIEQPLVPLENAEITIISSPNRSINPVILRSVVAEEELGYDSDDDVQPLSDF